jgi:CheY-like chemotaxis protein
LKRLLLNPSQLPLNDELQKVAGDNQTIVVTSIREVIDELDSDDYDALCFYGDIQADAIRDLHNYLKSVENFNHPVLPVFAVGEIQDERLKGDLESNAQFHFLPSVQEFTRHLEKIPSRWVLVIDDNKELLVSLKGELTANGFFVETSKNIQTGMEKFLKNEYMAVMVDVNSYQESEIKMLVDYVKNNSLGKQKAAVIAATNNMEHSYLKKLEEEQHIYTTLLKPLPYGVVSSVLKELFYNYEVAINSVNIVTEIERPEETQQQVITEDVVKPKEDVAAVINKKDKFGRTPLMLLALQGDLLKARSFIISGATLPHVDKNKKTAFSYALAGKNLILIELFLNNGALEHCFSSESDPVIEIMQTGDETLYKMLFKYSPNLNRLYKKRPYLVHAIFDNNTEFFEMLLKHGASPLNRGKDGLNCLDWIRKERLVQFLDIVQNHLKKKSK